MAKYVTLGNGELLVGFDRYGRVQDLHYPYVGLENHVALHHIHHVGVWVEGRFSWLNDTSWRIDLHCDSENFAGSITALHEVFRIQLVFTDVVYNEKNILLREVEVHNLDETTEEREIKVFFGQQFQISESRRGDTAYFDPRCSAVIHYKGRRAFLANMRMGKTPLSEYSIGLFDIEGREGTFRDAEDGVLEKNPIEHSSVDSVIGMRLSVRGRNKKRFHYWLAVGKSVEEVRELNQYVIERGPMHLMKTASDYWHVWVNRQNFSFWGLSEEIITLFKQSLFIIRAHTDNRGAIIASGDSDLLHHGRDSYHYMWPRDGSRAALALDMAGDANVAQRFFSFCNRILNDEDGYFMHKYLPDGSLGSSWHPWIRDGKIELPIQEDETALVLVSLAMHYELTRDIEFIESLYNSLIVSTADFLLEYRYRNTALPYPSYDLWEQYYGISAFTCGAVYSALREAANLASLLGKHDAADKYSRGALSLKNAIEEHFYNEERGMFYKIIHVENDQMVYNPTLDMSSFFSFLNFGVFHVSDERIIRSAETLERELLGKTEIGGMPRFEEDGYFRMSPSAPPNPWIITTLWFAQYYIKRARSEQELEPAKRWLSWVSARARSSGVLPEQVHPYTGEPISATPLVWSHAEFVITVVQYLNKLEELGVCKACNPVD
jgi:oligosaccharide amylase